MIVERIAVGETLDHVLERPDFAGLEIISEFSGRDQSRSDRVPHRRRHNSNIPLWPDGYLETARSGCLAEEIHIVGKVIWTVRKV